MATAKRLTKAQIIAELSDKSGLTKKDVTGVFEGLRELIKRELGSRGPGEFVIPDLLKLKVRKIPAQKNRKFRNPQTGEVVIKNVPASKKLRASPLKKLKELVL